jgi:hypothetical protein
LVLLNFLEEGRISNNEWLLFGTRTLHIFAETNNSISAYRGAILKSALQKSLVASQQEIPVAGLHFASRRYLVRRGYIEIPQDEIPSKIISLKKPLGSDKPLLWVTFEKSVDLKKLNSTNIRDSLGLPVGPDDFLYYFPITLQRPTYIPSVFDAFAAPPFRPVSAGSPWGTTRNLVDDSLGLPEVLIEPLGTLSGSPTGFLVDSVIDSPPPTGYVHARLRDYWAHPDYKHRRSLCP